jgi:hypothetical protein
VDNKKDLIIGAASNYSWEDLQYWVNSIRATDFSGDVALVGTNMSKKSIDWLLEKKVILNLYGTVTADNDVVSTPSQVPHVERFFYLWNFLNTLLASQYRYVITTDTRDVVFQKNPSRWLNRVLGAERDGLVSSSEGLRYKNEPWGDKNLKDTFGSFFHSHLKDEMIQNVGVIAGKFDIVKGLMLHIFHMSLNRPIPIVDQAVYNMIINTEPWKSRTMFTTNVDGWAIQLGTTYEAVLAGSGELGQAVQRTDYGSVMQYESNYEDQQPRYIDNEIVTQLGEPFVVVHQYDRIPKLKEQIKKLYGEPDARPNTIFHHPV